MKKLLILASLLFLSHFIYGSDWDIPGYYINKKGDSTKCTFILHKGFLATEPNDIDGENLIEIITLGNKKMTLLADTITAIVFKNKEERKFVSVKNDFGFPKKTGQYIFIEFLLNDYFKLYLGRYNYTAASGPNSFSNVTNLNYYFQRGDSLLTHVETKSLKFKEQICSLLFDNAELVNKIWKKKYGFDNTVEIFKEYNAWKKHGPNQSNDTTIYFGVDPSPIFDGREIDDLNYYFKSKTKWPKKAGNIEKLIFQGIVEKDGSLTHINMRGFKDMPEINGKFLEIAKTMKRWTPALLNGSVVRTSVTFIIQY